MPFRLSLFFEDALGRGKVRTGFVQKSRFAQKLTILHRKSDTRNTSCLVRLKEGDESRPPPFSIGEYRI